MPDGETVHERLQREITEIAEVLARRQGKRARDVWEHALSLHRVRYEREPLPSGETE
jgi:hypothetical protein